MRTVIERQLPSTGSAVHTCPSLPASATAPPLSGDVMRHGFKRCLTGEEPAMQISQWPLPRTLTRLSVADRRCCSVFHAPMSSTSDVVTTSSRDARYCCADFADSGELMLGPRLGVGAITDTSKPVDALIRMRFSEKVVICRVKTSMTGDQSLLAHETPGLKSNRMGSLTAFQMALCRFAFSPCGMTVAPLATFGPSAGSCT